LIYLYLDFYTNFKKPLIYNRTHILVSDITARKITCGHLKMNDVVVVPITRTLIVTVVDPLEFLSVTLYFPSSDFLAA